MGAGTDWQQAVNSLPCMPTDVLAIGVNASPLGVFLLGAHASKIIRSSPVPALTVPRTPRDTQ